MNFSPKAIFFDIDGTIINHNGGPFKDDLKAMKKAARRGHYLFLNTGRSFSCIPEKLPKLRIWSGIVAGGGAHILLADAKLFGTAKLRYKTFYHKWVDARLLPQICSWYLENNKALILEGEKNCYVIHPSLWPYDTSALKLVTHKDDFYNKYSGDFITKLTIDGSLCSEEQNLIKNYFAINCFPHYTEAIIKGEDKARGMSIVLDAVGIKREDSIAIGDSVNDIDMLRYAGLGIAMGNADDKVKAEAGALTGNCGEGGIAEAIERYVF